ncbi:4369_t:CDS:2, partial [Cetraspora pellucida]
DHLLKEYPEVNSYMKQWKSISHMWAYCYTNKNVNYSIRMTQCLEASNTYLKCLLGHIVPLPELINMLEKLSQLLKNVSMIISDFVYSLLLAQYNSATLYSIEEQGIDLFKVFNKNHDHIVYYTEIELVCHCDYSLQFSLPCHHIIAVHLTCKESLEVNYIGTHWIIPATDTNNEIEIVKINNCLSLFIKKLNNQSSLQQANIGDSTNIKTKGRPSNTKYKKTGAEHSTKKTY